MIKRLALALVTVVLLASSIPTHALAGAIGSADTGGGGAPTSGRDLYFKTPLQWQIKRGVATGASIKDTHQYPVDSHTIQKNDSIAYVTTAIYRINGKQVAYPNNWYRWKHWISEGHGDPAKGINPLLWDAKKLLPNDFIQEARASGFSNTIKTGALYKRGSDYADLVWIQGAVMKKESTGSRTVITSYVNNKDGSAFNNSPRSNQWHYDNPVTSVPYSYKSPKNIYSFNHTIKATSKTVTKRTTWDEDSRGNRSNIKTTYSSSNARTTTVGASWAADVPDLSYKVFKPLDLGTEKTATKAVLSKGSIPTGDYRKTSITADIDNRKGAGESKTGPLQVLDTNTARSFRVAFGNDQFGIPTKAKGGIDVSAKKPAFKESLNRVQIYWAPKIGAASTNRTFSPALTSLSFGKKEYSGNKSIEKSRGWRAGDFEFRSIKAGTYSLGHKKEPFWYIDMETGIYFKYGGGYSGTIRTGPSGPVFSSATRGKLATSHNNRWVGSKTMSVKQPVLYGEFEVKTVGGYKKP